MIGRNTLYLNQATINEAVRSYLNKSYASVQATLLVESVEQASDGKYETQGQFKVVVNMEEKK